MSENRREVKEQFIDRWGETRWWRRLRVHRRALREIRWPCIDDMLTAAVWSALILWGLISDIRTSEEEDVGDDIIHRRQECGEYYRRGHERDKQPRRRQQRSVCGLKRSQNLQRPSWIRIKRLVYFTDRSVCHWRQQTHVANKKVIIIYHILYYYSFIVLHFVLKIFKFTT